VHEGFKFYLICVDFSRCWHPKVEVLFTNKTSNGDFFPCMKAESGKAALEQRVLEMQAQMEQKAQQGRGSE
jgi:hypothetical protein